MVEYLDVVDENDNVVRRGTRDDCHKNHLIHRGVYVFVSNSKDQIFLQKRIESKDMHPGYYTASASGHADAGEMYDQAAKRELKEELNIDVPFKRLCKFKNFSSLQKEFCMLYSCNYDGEIKFNEKEISEGKFFDREEIEREITRGKKKFTPGFKIAFKKYYRASSD